MLDYVSTKELNEFYLDDHKSVQAYIASETIVDAINSLDPIHMEMSEGELLGRGKPSKTDYGLRINFNKALQKVQDPAVRQKKIQAQDIYGGVCTKQNFYNIIKNKNKLAYIIRPMVSFEAQVQMMLAKYTQRLWEISEMPIRKRKKVSDAVLDSGRRVIEKAKYEWQWDTRAAEVILKAYTELANRAKGMAVQRTMIQQHVQHFKSKDNNASEEMEVLDAKIEKLQSELKSTNKRPEARIAESTGEEEEV